MTKNFVDKLGLDIKRKLKNPYNVGDKMIDDIARANNVAELYDFIGYSLNEYQKCLEDTVNDATVKMKDDYYIEITFQKDKLLNKVFRLVPIIRNTCPLPFYDKDVYFFDKKEQSLKLLWSIPAKNVCKNKALIPLTLEGKEQLIESIDNFNNGNYFKVYQRLIGEIND